MRSFVEVLRRWPSRRNVAADCRVEIGAVKQWERRGSVPGAYWGALVAGARARGFDDVTLDLLAELAKRPVELRDHPPPTVDSRCEETSPEPDRKDAAA